MKTARLYKKIEWDSVGGYYVGEIKLLLPRGKEYSGKIKLGRAEREVAEGQSVDIVKIHIDFGRLEEELDRAGQEIIRAVKAMAERNREKMGKGYVSLDKVYI